MHECLSIEGAKVGLCLVLSVVRVDVAYCHNELIIDNNCVLVGSPDPRRGRGNLGDMSHPIIKYRESLR